MAQSFSINVIEHSKVSPPPSKQVQPQYLPLTYLDIPWLFFPPGKHLFFYEYHYSFSHFETITLPKLKRSLSLTLQHFFPLAVSLSLPQDESKKPHFINAKEDFVCLTVAETEADFNHMSSNHPRAAKQFHSLVPRLDCGDRNSVEVPMLAVQVTFFSSKGGGICIGLAFHHVAADGRTFHNFLKTWASFCSPSIPGGDLLLMNALPSHDRSLVLDSKGLEEVFLKQWWDPKYSRGNFAIGYDANTMDILDMVRATFVVSLIDMDGIKKLIISQCSKNNLTSPTHLSPYVLTCSLVWLCLLKSEVELLGANNCPDPKYFGFIAGGMTRLEFQVPTTYIGNCVGFGRCKALIDDLLGENGLVIAARIIGDTIKRLDKGLLKGAEDWISDWQVFFGTEPHLMVVGSPKVDLYEIDFGWGRPRKIEEISIDCLKAISLTKSRGVEGGIEVGLALHKDQMDGFISFYNHYRMNVHFMSLSNVNML